MTSSNIPDSNSNQKLSLYLYPPSVEKMPCQFANEIRVISQTALESTSKDLKTISSQIKSTQQLSSYSISPEVEDHDVASITLKSIGIIAHSFTDNRCTGTGSILFCPNKKGFSILGEFLETLTPLVTKVNSASAIYLSMCTLFLLENNKDKIINYFHNRVITPLNECLLESGKPPFDIKYQFLFIKTNGNEDKFTMQLSNDTINLVKIEPATAPATTTPEKQVVKMDKTSG